MLSDACSREPGVSHYICTGAKEKHQRSVRRGCNLDESVAEDNKVVGASWFANQARQPLYRMRMRHDVGGAAWVRLCGRHTGTQTGSKKAKSGTAVWGSAPLRQARICTRTQYDCGTRRNVLCTSAWEPGGYAPFYVSQSVSAPPSTPDIYLGTLHEVSRCS